MATWVAHFRIAQTLLEKGYDFHRQMFLVGNIAPDSGRLAEDKISYIPDKNISHWRNSDGDIEPEHFYQTYLTQRPTDDAEFAFFMGYYCHLIADREWTKQVWRPKTATPLYSEPLEKNKQSIWEIKKDWYGLDFLYLKEHSDCIFYTDFIYVNTVPDYLSDFPDGAFTQRITETKTFYLKGPDWDLDRPYIYLTRLEWNTYIDNTIVEIEQSLKHRVNFI